MRILWAALDAMRRARLRALLTHRLSNAGDVWRAYRAGTDVPALKFRDGGTLYHGPGDSPVFLFFEIFANGCYRRQLQRPPRGRIVDIGANIGAFTIDCGQRFRDVQIACSNAM
jgi:hypothetical protein